MLEYQVGSFAKSLAGHDKDKLYVIIKEDGEYAVLVDGKSRTLENPKKKKKKHIQLICHHENPFDRLEVRNEITDEDIRTWIGRYKREDEVI